MLIIMIVNWWFLYMGGSSTIFKQKILARCVAVGAGQVAVRSATRQTAVAARRLAALGLTWRTAVAVRLGGRTVRRPIAADGSTAAWGADVPLSI
jgi:hypothetical protein